MTPVFKNPPARFSRKSPRGIALGWRQSFAQGLLLKGLRLNHLGEHALDQDGIGISAARP
jgi:hypothetical protein